MVLLLCFAASLARTLCACSVFADDTCPGCLRRAGERERAKGPWVSVLCNKRGEFFTVRCDV